MGPGLIAPKLAVPRSRPSEQSQPSDQIDATAETDCHARVSNTTLSEDVEAETSEMFEKVHSDDIEKAECEQASGEPEEVNDSKVLPGRRRAVAKAAWDPYMI